MKLEYHSDNLILRILDERNASAVLDFYSRNSNDFDRYETDKPSSFYTLSFISNLLRAEYQSFIHGKMIRFFVFRADNPSEIVGSISFSEINPTLKSCVIGYKVDKAYRRQGIGTRMLTTALRIIVSELNMHRVEAYIHPDNAASDALAHRLGFIDEGTAYSYAPINSIWTDHMRRVFIAE